MIYKAKGTIPGVWDFWTMNHTENSREANAYLKSKVEALPWKKNPGFDEWLVGSPRNHPWKERKMIWTKLSWLCFQPLIFRNLYEFVNILVVNTGWLFADLRFNIEMCRIYFRWFVLYLVCIYIYNFGDLGSKLKPGCQSLILNSNATLQECWAGWILKTCQDFNSFKR